MNVLIGIGLTLAYILFLAFAWGACIAAGRADAGNYAPDDGAEWLGIGSDSFPHDRSNDR